MKTLKWLAWKFVYLFYYPQTLVGIVSKGMRLKSPWWKFEPYCFYNKDGKQWHICFSDEQEYSCRPQLLRVEPKFGMDSGKVVGLTIWDESLTKLEK